MAKKTVVFNVSDNSIVFIQGFKIVLDGIVGLGIGGAALDTKIQMLPFVTLACFAIRLLLSYLVKTWVEQAIEVEDK